MSQKGKRPSHRPENDSDPPVKRRKGRPPGSLNKDHTKNAVALSSLVDNDGDSSYGTIGLSSSQAALAVASTSKSWQPKPHNDLKSIYNRSAPEAPAELFRKDLISAMKLPDSEPLSPDEYWLIVDQWKQEWERGVQVPVNPDSLPEASVNNIKGNYIQRGRQDFKLPKNKYIRITKDESFSHEQHYLSHTPAMAESVCAYDLDQCDEAWLKICNGERALAGLSPISDTQFERVVEELEVRCWDKIQSIMKNEDGLGIEYDENVICDVCRSPDSEEANEMVFCDNCNICVHQACYGITAIPSGQWLCRTCTTGIKPDCVLCPNKGGAMKSTRSGTKWAHVSCALWIPEVSIGSVDRMEPITKISNIPQSRWALNCILCREKVGACIQCSVKTCKTAYHVTCAFQHGLEMRAIIEDEHNEDGVKLRSYCQKHSTTKTKKDGKNSNNKTSTTSAGSGTDEDDNKRRRTRKEMSTEERNQVRAQRLAEIESEFHKHVNIKDISCHLLDIDQEGINYIYNYWILKRKSGNNRPLLPPKNEDAEFVSQKEENQEQEKMRMFVQLRQDLERVRNLCYMVSRREKLARSFFKMREQTFHKQISILADLKYTNAKKLDDYVINAVLEANHGPSIYDKLYSSDSVSNINNKYSNSEVANNIDVILDRLININSGSSSNRHKSPRQASSIDIGSNSSLEKINLSPRKLRQPVDINGINNNNQKNLSNKSSNASAMASSAVESSNNLDNPYKRTYFNGTTASRKSASLCSSTGFSSDSDHSKKRHTLRGSFSASSSEGDSHCVRQQKKSTTPINVTSPTTNKLQSSKVSPRRRSQNTKAIERKRRRDGKQDSVTSKLKSSSIVETSSEDEENQRFNVRSPRNRTLQQMEKELHDERSHLSESTDSDELTGICYKPTSYSQTKVPNAIYSDSDSTDKDKTDNTASDSQQHPFRTKAAMKEFNINALTTSDRIDTFTSNPLTKTKQLLPKGILKNSNEKISLTHVTNLEHDKMIHTNNSKAKDKNRQDKSLLKKNDFPADLLVVPQRQAAKKASENLMRTNVPTIQQMSYGSKKDSKSDVETTDNKSNRFTANDEPSDKKLERRISSKGSSRNLKRQESKDNSSDRESKNRTKEEMLAKKEDTSFADLLPYVPQRQAAKKAAEHIKSSVLKPSETAMVVPPESEVKPVIPKRVSSKKDDTLRNDVSDSSSSESESSSSSSSSESGSKVSSSSSEDSDPVVPQKVTQSRQSTNSNKGSVGSRRTTDKAKDLPFLDKGNKSAGTVFCSSESDSDSKSSSDESVEPQKQVPAKITKRKSSSAATSISHKSTSSGVGTSTGTNTTSGTGRPRGRPRTKSILKESQKSKPVQSTSVSSKERENKDSTSKKDESISGKLSTINNSNNTTPAKATTRGHRDSKVQINEDATASSRRKTSDGSPRVKSEVTDIKTRRKSVTIQRESLTSPIKDKIHPIASGADQSQENRDTNEESKTTCSIATRKRKLSTTAQKEETCYTQASVTERSKTQTSPRNEITSNKTDKTNDKTCIITSSKRDPDQRVSDPTHDTTLDQSLDSINETIVKNIETSRSSRDTSVKTPEKLHKSPIKKQTRTSSDMEIDPMNSPPYVLQLSQSADVTNKNIKLSAVSTITGITDNSKNNGPKSIFDITDDLTETNEAHFEVPATPLAFTSHHSDWLKVDANEDTEQATLDLVEKLRQNKQKMHNQNELSDNQQDSNQKKDTIETNESNLEELNTEINSKKQQSISIDDELVFDKPLDKLKNSKESQQSIDLIRGSQQKQQLIGLNQMNSQIGSPTFNQESYMYGQKWNESEIIARRRSVSSSPASTVSDNTELQHHAPHEKSQTQLQSNIQCSVPGAHFQQQTTSKQQTELGKSTFDNSNQMQSHLPLLSQDQIPLQMQSQNQMPLGQQPMVSFPPINQNQIISQHRSFKQDSCMYYNTTSHQRQTKPVIGLPSSPTYQLGPRSLLYGNQLTGNKMENNSQNVNVQNYSHPMGNDPCKMSIGSLQQPSMQELLKIKSSPQNNRDIIQSVQQQQNVNRIPTVSMQATQPPLQQQQHQQQSSINDSSNLPPSTVSLADLKKSPPKTIPKLSVRNTYQQNIENMQNPVRSPHLNTKMSPGKSPKQMDMISKQANISGKNSKGSSTMTDVSVVKGRQRSNSTKTTGQNNRGRNSGGNKKGRGKNLTPFNEFDFGGTNHSNLAGTAYDLDLVEEEHFTLGNYRTSLLRDRKKSNDTSSMDYLRSREPSQSPKFSSPKNRSLYSSAANTPTAGTTSSGNTPLHQGHHPLMTPEVNNSTVGTISSTSNVPTSLQMVLPVLPGPVDMRTYNSNFDSSTNNELYNNHLLGAFDSGAADHTLADIDEEMEKELQSALKASNSKSKQTTTPVPSSTDTATTISTVPSNANNTTIVTENLSKSNAACAGPEPPEEASVDSDTMRVSFSDSRNQLKLKIKGPLAPDSYSSTIINQKTAETSVSITTTAPTVAPGLRRMRKKELLRQYWTQDANLDDQTSSSLGDTIPSIPVYSMPNRVAGIPKAVDSMSSIPTKEDYKDYNMTDTKKRKKVSGLQRELRQLSGPSEDDTVERRRSIGNASDKSSNASISGRNRLNRSGPVTGQTPKLKIKIGTNVIEPSGISCEEVRQSNKPPKKRLDNMVGYSLEDLRRDCLNYRKQVIADFDKKAKIKEKGADKERKKKKKDKKRKVEIIENDQKFVLKIKKPKLDCTLMESSTIVKPEKAASQQTLNAEHPLSVDSIPPIKSAPIKLKLARTSGTTSSYTLTSKQDQKPVKKQTKKQASTTPNNHKVKSKDSNVAPIKKRELTECQLRLEKLDPHTIQKFSSNAGNKLTVSLDEASCTNDSNTLTQQSIDSHLGAVNSEINNSSINLSSGNNNLNTSESNTKDVPISKGTEDDAKIVQQENTNNATNQKSSENSGKDCVVR